MMYKFIIKHKFNETYTCKVESHNDLLHVFTAEIIVVMIMLVNIPISFIWWLSYTVEHC